MTQIKSDRHFKIIYDQLINSKDTNLSCDISKCRVYSRNNRQKEIISIECKDKRLPMFIDILDTIHCYFIHSVDIAYRIIHDDDKPLIEETKANDDNNYNIHISSEISAYDPNIKRLKTYMGSKRKQLEKLRGDRRVRNSKFITRIGSLV